MPAEIFYSDGERYIGIPERAPRKGVQFIKNNGKILRPADYYLWRPSLGMWTEHVDAASVIVAASKERWTILLLGEYIPDDRFKEITQAAIRAEKDKTDANRDEADAGR